MIKEKYLPIGTVCRLKEGKKYLMIIGFCQSASENPNTIYDYNGCMYPEGVVSPEINFLFNHDQIEEILYDGFINDEEITFKNKLKEFLMTGKINGKEIKVDDNGNITLETGEIDISDNSVNNQIENNPLNVEQSQQDLQKQPIVESVVAPTLGENQPSAQNINTNSMDLFGSLPSQPNINNFMNNE